MCKLRNKWKLDGKKQPWPRKKTEKKKQIQGRGNWLSGKRQGSATGRSATSEGWKGNRACRGSGEEGGQKAEWAPHEGNTGSEGGLSEGSKACRQGVASSRVGAPFPHLHSPSQLPCSPTQLKGHFFYSTPSPLSSTMPHIQHQFPQFDVSMQSTLSTMQFPPLFQVSVAPSPLPHPRSTQNWEDDEIEGRTKE
jgi:hypothetical protein